MTTANLKRQEFAYYVFFAALSLFLVAVVVGGIWFAIPRPQQVRIGKLTDFPPRSSPYVVTSKVFVYVVNTGTEVLVINPRYTTDNGTWNCKVLWVPTNNRYEDPCSGAKFGLDGAWLPTAYQPPIIEPRGLARYAIQLRNNEIWIEPAYSTPGALAGTATSE